MFAEAPCTSRALRKACLDYERTVQIERISFRPATLITHVAGAKISFIHSNVESKCV